MTKIFTNWIYTVSKGNLFHLRRDFTLSFFRKTEEVEEHKWFFFLKLFKGEWIKLKWHAWPQTTLKYKSSTEHLSGLCIWSFLPLSSIQLTTGCWKVLSAIRLAVITTVALCSDPGLSWRARGHVPFHNAASWLQGMLLFHKGWCFTVTFFFLAFLEAVSDRGEVEQTKRAGDIWQRFTTKFWSRE